MFRKNGNFSSGHVLAVTAGRNRDRIVQRIRRESHFLPGRRIRHMQCARIACRGDGGFRQIGHRQNRMRIVALKAASDIRSARGYGCSDARFGNCSHGGIVGSPSGVVGVFVIRGAVSKSHVQDKCLRLGSRNRRVRGSEFYRRDKQIAYRGAEAGGQSQNREQRKNSRHSLDLAG